MTKCAARIRSRQFLGCFPAQGNVAIAAVTSTKRVYRATNQRRDSQCCTGPFQPHYDFRMDLVHLHVLSCSEETPARLSWVHLQVAGCLAGKRTTCRAEGMSALEAACFLDLFLLLSRIKESRLAWLLLLRRDRSSTYSVVRPSQPPVEEGRDDVHNIHSPAERRVAR